MASKHKLKLIWLKALSSVALVLGGFWSTGLPATAMPNIDSLENDIYLTQVGVSRGVQSRVVPPTPLNLTPRYHIPLPQSNYYRDRGRYYDYYDHNDYDRDRHHHHHDYDRRRSRSRSPIIIINPAVEQHRSTNQKYIRIIRSPSNYIGHHHLLKFPLGF